MKKSIQSMTKKELMEQIHEKDRYIKNLEDTFRKHSDTFLKEFKWAGNLGEWVWYYDINRVIFNDKKVLSIGYNPELLGNIGFEFFTNKLHPDDYERVMNNMKNHLMGISEAYEVEYRILHKHGHYVWYYDRGIVTKRDDKGKPVILQGVVFDISNAKQVEERLKYLSERDDLTKVYNRRMLFATIHELMKEKIEYKRPFSIIMIDIDHFKEVNDTFGHLVGDEVLVDLVRMINDDKRSHDEVFRYGGEEFFIVLPETNLQGAIKLGERIHMNIQQEHIPKIGHITISMGIVEYKDKETIDEVIKRVDDMMYLAKGAGRNCIKYE